MDARVTALEEQMVLTNGQLGSSKEQIVAQDSKFEKLMVVLERIEASNINVGGSMLTRESPEVTNANPLNSIEISLQLDLPKFGTINPKVRIKKPTNTLPMGEYFQP